MSVTFWIAGLAEDVEADDSNMMNVSSVNARDICEWIGIEHRDLNGEISASELAAKCRRRLWPESRNFDPAIDGRDEKLPGRARVIECGRPDGYLREKTEKLLELAERAGTGVIWFG